MLASSGAGIDVRSGTKGALPRSQGHLYPEGRRDEGSTVGEADHDEWQAPKFPGGGKHPDCRDDSPLRGGGRDGDLDRSDVRKASPASRIHAAPVTHGVLERGEGGESSSILRGPWKHASADGRWGAFTSIRSAHAFTSPVTHPSSARPTVGSSRRLARGEPRGRWSSMLHAAAGLCRRDAAPKVRVWLAACSSLDGEGLSHAAGAEGRRREAEDNAAARAETPSRRSGRGLDARGWCSRVVFVVAEVDGRCSAQRSARSTSPDLESVRRRAPQRVTSRESARSRVKKHRVAARSGNLT